MSKFFIRRPIVAIVIAIVTVILGVVSLASLPTSQYPDIVPPEILVTATYPGADSKTVSEAVSTPIEQQMNGVDNMIYMDSVSANNGVVQLFVDFDVKTNPDIDQVLAQLRVDQAQSQLPAQVTIAGLTVAKSLTSPLMLIAINSPGGKLSQDFLTNYAVINLQDQIARVPGVSRVQVFGGIYAMRVWVNPDAMAKLGVTAPEVIAAIQIQNNVNPAGQIGGEPIPKGQQFTYTVRTQGRLVKPEEFGAIVIRANPDGSIVHLSDIARVELGEQAYTISARYNQAPAGVMAIYQLPGSNAVQTAAAVNARMKELSASFPAGITYDVPLDTTKAVTAGIHEIVLTLLEALGLVVIVVFIFLQGWRAKLIPLLAVPVSLIGTFLVFPMLGFSINTLSLFGLVLAIGLVVDDAIVVVEAIEHHIEHGLSPKDAALKAMEEVSGPVIGIAIVLSAVFIPTAFVPGITGRLYQQFAVTIAVSVIFSAFNTLTLSPALSALMLRPKKPTRGPLGAFFRGFNKGFGHATNGYASTCSTLIHKMAISILLLLGFTFMAGYFGGKLPKSFLPEEDQGYLFGALQLPDASSLQRTSTAAVTVEDILKKTPGIDHVTTVVGYNMLSGVQNTYSAFFWITLKEWKDRTTPEEQYWPIKIHLITALREVTEGTVLSFPPPAIPGVGASGGATFILEDRQARGNAFLAENLKKFMAAARKRPEFALVFTTALPSVPQLFVKVDRDKVLKQGVPLADVYQTLQAFMGGAFINFFNRFGRVWQIYIQAEGDFRTQADNVAKFYVRNSSGQMVPLSAVTTIGRRLGPEFTMHYNLYNCIQINGNTKPGYSSEQAMKALEEVFAQTMPPGMGFDYMGMS